MVNTLASGLTNTTGIAVDASGNVFVTDYGTGSYSVASGTFTEIQRSGVNFGSAAVATTTPATETLTCTFTTGGTIKSPVVITQGAPHLDFTDAGLGTCTGGATFSTSSNCTLVVNFVPTHPGTRRVVWTAPRVP
jgi:hypothetical protein